MTKNTSTFQRKSEDPSDRTISVAGFLSISHNATAAALIEKLKSLINSIPDDWSKDEKRKFKREMEIFHRLFTKFLRGNMNQALFNWEYIKPPNPGKVISYDTFPDPPREAIPGLMDKLAVIKLNGGLGTTMGCVGPKSAIDVKEGMKFIDLTIRQIEYLNEVSGAKVPLILMNSFNTDQYTRDIIEKYINKGEDIRIFNQSHFPRIDASTFIPIADSAESPGDCWYPPGHGDIFESLNSTGLLDELLEMNKEYIFISNADNLGATVDMKILNYLETSGCEFIMEVTNKTKADIKGGTLIERDGKLLLLEIAQVPEAHVDDFKSMKELRIFNTNNIWISLKAIKHIVENGDFNLDVIINHKKTPSGRNVIQLETAVGAAIKNFVSAHAVNVPRCRFLPVKSTDDLFLVTSDLYTLEHGTLKLNPKRIFPNPPLVKLGEHFKSVEQFRQRLKYTPHILDLDNLIISGDVHFGKDVTLAGTVIIIASDGQVIDIPPGAKLIDKVVSGNLRILNH